MYDYTRSFGDNFRSSIKRVGNTLNNNTNSSAPAQQQASGAGALSAVTPDYNVVVPTGYTKIGVEKLHNGQEIHCYKLNNGQKVYIAPKESAMTTLMTYVNTGSMNEKDSERGISHFCEHMAFNGTLGTDNYMKLNVGDSFNKVDKMGGMSNAATSFAETNYIISIPQFNKDDFENAVKMQSSMMNNLEMSDEMVEKEHAPVTSEINMYADMPEVVIQNEAIKNLYNIQSTSENLIAGRVDNILNIDKTKVMSYYKNNYYPANMSTVVTGDVNPDEAIEIIAKNFRGQNPPNPERRYETFTPIEKTVRRDIFSNKAVGTSGAICFDGPALNNLKDSVAVELLTHYLFNKDNSRLDSQLKDYNVSTQASVEKISANPAQGQLITISYDTTEENSEVALRGIFSNLANFKVPTPQEFESLKTAIKIDSEKSYENMLDLNYQIGKNVGLGDIDNVTKKIAVLESLTPQDLVNTVNKYFNTEKASVAIIHPEATNVQKLSENYTKAKTISFTGLNNVNASSQKVKQPIDVSEVKNYKFNNNVEVAMMNSKNDIANYSILFNTPVPANLKPGVSDVLSRMLVNKSKTYSKFNDLNNISLSFGAGDGGMYFNTEVPSKNLNASMDLMKELLLNPDFSAKNFEEAKQAVKSELSIARPHAITNAFKELYPDRPRGYTDKEILENIDKLELSDIVGFYSYIKENSTAACSASLPTEKYPEAKYVFDNQIATMPQVKPMKFDIFNDFTQVQRSKVVREASNSAQAEVVQAYKFYNDHSPKSKVVNGLLTSILSNGDETGLFNNLREKEKLAYRVEAAYDPSSYASSTLYCFISTTTDSPESKSYDNVQRSINGFNNQIGKMANGEFTDEELKTAKIKLKRSLLETCDLQSDKVMALRNSMNSSNGIAEYNTMYNMIDSITKEDIVNGAKYIFSQKPIYSIRATQDTLDYNREYLDRLEG